MRADREKMRAKRRKTEKVAGIFVSVAKTAFIAVVVILLEVVLAWGYPLWEGLMFLCSGERMYEVLRMTVGFFAALFLTAKVFGLE